MICTALGGDQCPLRTAVANWLDKDRVALWEPGRPIMLLDAKNPTGREVGAIGSGAGQYHYVTAVGPYEGAIAVIDIQRLKLIRYKADGSFEREDDIPRPGANSSPGFIGATPVLQSISAEGDSAVAHLTVDVMESYGQKKGTRVLDVPVPWLRLSADSAVGESPLFPASPSYVVDVNGTIVWTPGDTFWVQRRTFAGTPKWTLQSDRRGEPVTQADIDARRAAIMRDAPKGMLSERELDSMTAHSGKTLPVFSGMVLEPGGRILLAGATLAWRDSTQYIVLAADGTPTQRFALPSRTHLLLFAGDSLLVHRPTEGEPWEVRWLKLTPDKSSQK